MKEYKTNEELIDYLISKNVKVSNKRKALEKIEKYSYYTIVNSYKGVFKDGNNNYKPGVSFEEIFALYNFDKNIKFIFLKSILEIEIHIKSLMAAQIGRQYGIETYLDVSNLDDSVSDNVKEDLIEKINKEIDKDYKVHSAITHYKDKYGFIPPFILIKILTFGVMSSYYGLFKQSDRQSIARNYRISDKMLKMLLKNLTMIRNIAAHSDRLFCYRSKYNISFKNIDKKYKRQDNFTNLYMMIKAMELLLNRKQYNSFYKAFEKELYILKNSLISIDIDDILKIMGFPQNKNN